MTLSVGFSSPAMAQEDGAGTPTKPINGPPPLPPGVSDPLVNVTANRPRDASFVFGTYQAKTNRSLSLSGSRAFQFQNHYATVLPQFSLNDCDDFIPLPIQLSTGAEVETFTLFQLPGEMGLKYVLYYNSAALPDHWTSSLNYGLDFSCPDVDNPSGKCLHTFATRPDGSRLKFTGGQAAPAYTNQTGSLATLSYDAPSGHYIYHDEDATTQIFDSNGALIGITDASGVGWTVTHTSTTTTISDAGGRSFTITSAPVTQSVVNGQNVLGQVVTVTDPAGNVYTILFGNQYADNAEIIDVASISYPGTPATVRTFKYQVIGSSYLVEEDINGNPYAHFGYVTTTTSPYYQWANETYLGDANQSLHQSVVYSTDANGQLVADVITPLGHHRSQNYDGTNGSGGVFNGQLSVESDDAVVTCGSTAHGRAYDANGNLQTTVDNRGISHSYQYAANGQLQTETEAVGSAIARTTDYVWDPNVLLNQPLSVTIEGYKKTTYSYRPDNRLQSMAVTNLTSNGVANQTLTTNYTYALYPSGLVQTMTAVAPSPGGSNTITTTYDTQGNLLTSANGLGQTTTYSNYNALGEAQHVVGPNNDVTDYTYDERGRVKTSTTYPNGVAATWTYAYDGLGLLAALTAPDNQVTTWNRDPNTQWISTINHTDIEGTSTQHFTYDANGDVTAHWTERGGVASVYEQYEYDTLGRIYRKHGQNGQLLTYAYDPNGNVASVTDAVGHTIQYGFDELNRLTQTTESGGASPLSPSGQPAISVPGTSSSGAYVVSWNSITGASYYILQEQTGSSWATFPNNSGLSTQISGKTNGTYGYHVKACNATGCGPWSAVGTVTVAIPTAPTSAPSLSVSGTSANGTYTVSWTSVPTASTYQLQEYANGVWTTIQNNTSLSWSVSGRGNGNYTYMVSACNAVGCGPVSNQGTMVVSWPPVPANPGINAPAYSTNGAYTISWTGVANATNYPLYQSTNGGASWTLVQNTAATSWSVSGEGSGSYAYAISACDISGCSAQSDATVTVIIPEPIGMNGQSYGVAYGVPQGSTAGVSIGFDIINGNTWEVFGTKPGVGNAHVVQASGAVPAGAATVQYTWIDDGIPSGLDAAGSITNPAASPVAVSSNPFSQYTTASFSYRAQDRTHWYNLRVDFYNAAGVDISSSTCTLKAEVVGTQ